MNTTLRFHLDPHNYTVKVKRVFWGCTKRRCAEISFLSWPFGKKWGTTHNRPVRETKDFWVTWRYFPTINMSMWGKLVEGATLINSADSLNGPNCMTNSWTERTYRVKGEQRKHPLEFKHKLTESAEFISSRDSGDPRQLTLQTHHFEPQSLCKMMCASKHNVATRHK